MIVKIGEKAKVGGTMVEVGGKDGRGGGGGKMAAVGTGKMAG